MDKNAWPFMNVIGMATTVAAATETGLLLALCTRSATVAEHAANLNLDVRATERVVDLLVAHGFAERQGESVAASAGFRTWTESNPGGPDAAFALWGHVPTYLRTGEPLVQMTGASEEREKVYKNVVGALGRLFNDNARELAAQLDLAPAQILDVGCGSGVWSLAIAERFNQARVTGLDLPEVLTQFESRAQSLGLSDRIDRLPGDMHTVAVPEGAFDLVVIANVLRLEPPDAARQVLGRISKALKPDGQLLVIDALASGTPEREVARSTYALHLAMRSSEGRVHSTTTITKWLHELGLEQATPLMLSNGPQGAILASHAMAVR